MVWDGISGRHRNDLLVIQGNLNGIRYRDEILQQHVEPFMQNNPEVEMFQHHDPRPHTARIYQHSSLMLQISVNNTWLACMYTVNA